MHHGRLKLEAAPHHGPVNPRRRPRRAVDGRSDRRLAPVLDDVSKAIIEQLQQDGRRAYATIGKAVGLSEAAVRQRVQRLMDGGVMQIVAVTDPLQAGLLPRGDDRDPRPRATSRRSPTKLEAIEEIDYVVITAGSFDILVEVVCEDDDHLLELVAGGIRAIPGVRATETFVYLKLAQADLRPGVPDDHT